MNLTVLSRRTAFCLCCLASAAGLGALLPSGVWAAEVAPEFTAAKVRELGGISEYRLANGLQVLLFPDESQTTTTVNITYRVGSRHEVAGEFGMAHLLEHLLFKGTATQTELPKAFAARGISYNGTTNSDRTNYFGNFNANPETLAWLIALEADRMLNSRVAKVDLDTEMTVVRNEFERSDSNAASVLSQRVHAVAFDWHPYGHATIGNRSDIEQVPIENLRAFYQRHYRPDNATLLVAGRFDVAATLARIAQSFGPLKNPAQPLVQPWTREPAQDGERSVVVRRVGGLPMLMVHYHVPAASHPDTAALSVLGMLMSLQPSGHLYKALVETQKVLSVGLSGAGGHAPGSYGAMAVLPAGADVAAVEARLIELIEGRTDQPFAEADLRRVRELIAMGMRELMKQPQGLIQLISGQLGAGDWRLMFRSLEDVGQVTLADVERVRKAYLRAANRTVGRYLPSEQSERVEIPEAPPLGARLDALKPPPVVDAGEVFDPSYANLQARLQRKTLPSGAVLSVLPKQTRGSTVHLQLQARWASAKEMLPVLGTSDVGELLIEGGGRWNRQSLQDEKVRLRGGFSIVSGNNGLTLNLQAERDTLIPMLRLAAEVMRQPLFPQAAFDRTQLRHTQALEGSRKEPEVMRREATREHYNRAGGFQFGDLGYGYSVNEQLAERRRTTLNDVKRVWQDYWSMNDARVAVVGAVPPGLEAEIDALIGGWKKPAAPRFERYVPPYVEVPPARFDVQVDDKSNAILVMRQSLRLNRRDPAAGALQLATQIFGRGTDSRLHKTVREEKGLSYGVSSALAVPLWGDDGSFGIQGSFAPQRREAMVAAVLAELDRMGRDGVTEAELARAKTRLVEDARKSRASDVGLVATLNAQVDTGRGFADSAEREARLLKLTKADVDAAWRQYVRPDAWVISTAGDFARVGQ